MAAPRPGSGQGSGPRGPLPNRGHSPRTVVSRSHFPSPSGLLPMETRAIMSARQESSARGRVAGWTTTVLFSVAMTANGVVYLVGPQSVLTILHDQLGYPLYFRFLLGIAKLSGVAALLLPLPRRLRTLREWAYAGFTFD